MSNSSDNKHTVVREFGISTFAVNNKTSVLLFSVLILLGGIFSYGLMPRENFPEIVQPKIFIQVTYPGNSPVDIENLITRPIEKELQTLSGVKKISSQSIQDFAMIEVEFSTDVPVPKALQDTKDAVDKSKSELPTDLDKEPDIFEMDFSDFPILNINLSGDLEMDYLKEYAEYLKDEIEKLAEVSEVEIKGAREREVKIDMDVYAMNAMEISFSDVENAIKSENVTISGGDILTEGLRRNIRVTGEFTDPKQIENVIVKQKSGQVVFLRDIADIAFNFEERESYARTKTKPVVSLDVKKRSGENLINAIDKIKVILAKAQEEKFPSSLKISTTGDQSKDTRAQVANLENSIISGVILVVLVLLFFLGLRNSLFVGIAIPLSMLMGFAVLHFMDITLNVMVLFSLILALGMLVDNGIVVVENVYRMLQEGLSHDEAAKQGVGEVALPIIASTATTLAAFFPLLFWDDIWGEFMRYLPLTLIIVLSSSLFVALVINPVLTSLWMQVQNEREKTNYKALIIFVVTAGVLSGVFHLAKVPSMGNFLIILIGVVLLNVFLLAPAAHWFQHNLMVKIESAYSRLITFALRGWNPAFFLLGTLGLLIASNVILQIRAPKQSFLPMNEPKYVNVFIEMPLGTDIEETNQKVWEIEGKLLEEVDTHATYKQVIESIIVNVGAGTSDPMDGPSLGVTPHKGRITYHFIDSELRNGINTQDVMEAIREAVSEFPGVLITVDKDRNGPPAGKPVNIEVAGEDYQELIALSEDILVYLKSFNIPGIEELKLDLEKGKPELLVNVDRAAARRFGVSTSAVGQAIRTALFGKEVSKYKLGEDDYPIMLRLKESERYDLQSLLNQRISFKDQGSGKDVSVPISAVADIEYSSSFGSIKRKNLDRVITIASNVKEGYNANEINARIQKVMEDYDVPSGFTVKYTGEQEQQNDVLAFLISAFVVAIGLIALILVAQFNSVVKPFIIILSVFFSLIGVWLGFAIFRMDIIILMTGIGVVSLAGIVVNNAIVLIDYVDLIRQRRRKELGIGKKRLPFKEIVNSIIEGGKTRLRPVLLTAITTVLGLIPLAIGFNINFASLLHHWDPEIFFGGDNVSFWGPMAWTVIYGLSFATFLTLVIVPVMYLSFDFLAYWIENTFRKTSKELLEEE